MGQITNNDKKLCTGRSQNLVTRCQDNHLSLYLSKTKKLVINFRKYDEVPAPISINGAKAEALGSLALILPTNSHGMTTLMWQPIKHMNASKSLEIEGIGFD